MLMHQLSILKIGADKKYQIVNRVHKIVNQAALTRQPRSKLARFVRMQISSTPF